jgi:Restriction endonuclease
MTERIGYELEREVAAIYRALGAKVEHDVSLAGNQIDILVTEQTPSGSTIKYAVECKAYSRPVGVDVVNSFGAIGYLLKNRSLIDKLVLVSTNGFTHQARASASEHNLLLVELSDLKQRVRGLEDAVKRAEREVTYESQILSKDAERQKRVFVVMPFSREFDDVYVLGIREVAERLGLVVERADDIEHNGNILEIIQQSIERCGLVVADTTHLNPNVLYEVGYSHGVKTPTILITRAGETLSFDLQSTNHIFYETIIDLRERLERRIGETLDLK